MSLVGNLRGKSPAKYAPPQAPDIAQKLELAESGLVALEASRDAASLEAFSDAPSAKGNLAKLNADVRAAQDNIAMLRAAHRGALERDKAAVLRLRKDAIETALRSVTSSLALRDKSADLLAVALAEASRHYKAMHQSHERAQSAWTAAQMEWPIGAASANDLIRWTQGEAWRHTDGSLYGDPLALPAAAASKLEFQHNPTAQIPIDQILRNDSARIKELLAKKVPK